MLGWADLNARLVAIMMTAEKRQHWQSGAIDSLNKLPDYKMFAGLMVQSELSYL